MESESVARSQSNRGVIARGRCLDPEKCITMTATTGILYFTMFRECKRCPQFVHTELHDRLEHLVAINTRGPSVNVPYCVADLHIWYPSVSSVRGSVGLWAGSGEETEGAAGSHSARSVASLRQKAAKVI